MSPLAPGGLRSCSRSKDRIPRGAAGCRPAASASSGFPWPTSCAPNPRFSTAEGPGAARKFLLARRLVEAGVRVVSLSLSDFDSQTDNHDRMRELVPVFDHAFAALVTDLEERGMLDDVVVLAWGEFGRTPKINAKGGRDHWPPVAMGMRTGGGFHGGVFLGATDRHAAEAVERPVHYQDVIATLYHHLGIDPRTARLTDPTGRPQALVDVGQIIPESV